MIRVCAGGEGNGFKIKSFSINKQKKEKNLGNPQPKPNRKLVGLSKLTH